MLYTNFTHIYIQMDTHKICGQPRKYCTNNSGYERAGIISSLFSKVSVNGFIDSFFFLWQYFGMQELKFSNIRNINSLALKTNYSLSLTHLHGGARHLWADSGAFGNLPTVNFEGLIATH